LLLPRKLKGPVTSPKKPGTPEMSDEEREEEMFRTLSILRVIPRKCLVLCVLAVVAILVLLTGGNAVWAWTDADRAAVSLQATVPIPGTAFNTTGGRMFVFDISWVDQGV